MMAPQSVTTETNETEYVMNMAAHSEKTMTMIFQKHPNDPGGVLLHVTPAAAYLAQAMDTMNAEDRQDMLRVLRAMKAGLFNYSAAEVAAWTPAQRRAAIASLPKVRS